MGFNVATRRIGLFKEGAFSRIYLSDCTWDDLTPLLDGQTGIRVIDFTITFDINEYLAQSLKIDPSFTCIAYPVYVVGYQENGQHNTPCFLPFSEQVSFELIQEKISLIGTPPYEYTIRLHNGIEIGSYLWDDCTFLLPDVFFNEYAPRILALVSYPLNADLLTQLINKPEHIIHVDDRYNIVEIEPVDDFKDYMWGVYHDRL